MWAAGGGQEALDSCGFWCTRGGPAEEDSGVTVLCYVVHDVCSQLLCGGARLCSRLVIDQHDLDKGSGALGYDSQEGLCFVHLGYGHPHPGVLGLFKTQGNTQSPRELQTEISYLYRQPQRMCHQGPPINLHLSPITELPPELPQCHWVSQMRGSYLPSLQSYDQCPPTEPSTPRKQFHVAHPLNAVLRCVQL